MDNELGPLILFHVEVREENLDIDVDEELRLELLAAGSMEDFELC